MVLPPDIAAFSFLELARKCVRAEPSRNKEGVDRKWALLTKVADLAEIPDRNRESFITFTASILGYWMVYCVVSTPVRRNSNILSAYAKVLAARNAIAALSDEDRAMIDESREDGDIFKLLDKAAHMLSLFVSGDFAAAPKSGAGSPKGVSKDPLFRGFLEHLCAAIRSHEGKVTFTHKAGRPTTGTMVEILSLLQPDVMCIPRVPSSRAKMIKSALRQHGLATRVPQISE